MTTAEQPAAYRKGERAAYGINAVLAWLGVALTATISAAGGYAVTPHDPTLYGTHPTGLAAGVLSRLSDTLSYFTIWSNTVVGLSATLLFLAPRVDTRWRRILRIDALLMITITAIVYAVVLAPGDTVVGWSRLTNPILHQITPAVTLLVWLLWGPRGWFGWRTLPYALVIPLVWIGWMLARGVVVGAYPYDFADPAALGYGTAVRNLGFVLLFALVVAAVYAGVDVVLTRRRHRSNTPSS